MSGRAFRHLANYAGLLAALAILVGVFSLATDRFFQASTAVTILNQIPDLTLVAVGMTLVLVVGGIDLSVGSLVALCSAVVGVAMVDWGWPLAAAAAAAVAVGGLCGLFNGAVSVGFGIPSFIVTLGMLEIARGATRRVSDSQTKYIGQAVESLAEPVAGLAVTPAFLIALAAVALGQLALTRTVWGRYCVAIGTNAEAVRMSGVRHRPYAASAFVVSGLLCGVAGVCLTSRFLASDPNAAIGHELAAIAACVIGGTSLLGGRGSVIGTFLGVLIIAVLQSGLSFVGVGDANKQMITGGVIIVAVLIDAFRRRWSPDA